MRWNGQFPRLYSTQQHEQLAVKDVGRESRRNGSHRDKEELDWDLDEDVLRSWRVQDRMKTVSVALILCLNIGVDPPGVVKPNPCARMECWIDPLSMPPQRALDSIGKYLQQQYERWQPRARYKVSADPTVEEVRKLCTALRRNAKDEHRVLLHYNGHGVPLPTANGEIWVFNKSYTQYIPLSIYDLQMWMATPSIYVFDCSSAGLIVSSFMTFAQHREREQEQASQGGVSSAPPADDAAAQPTASYKQCILLAACAANELLPTNPELPADLFTSCLTTPIKMALRWFAPRSLLGIGVDKLDRIPGRLNDRKTLLGELNWIFTAITDTIAWNVLPRDLFKRLFRQDLLVASLFRNFLLAERIMWTVNCTPVSEPKLPTTHSHPLWQAWDYTVEQCLAQLPGILAAEDAAASGSRSSVGNGAVNGHRGSMGTADEGEVHQQISETAAGATESFQYTPNTFFEDQMTAFEVWLAMGPDDNSPPEQLPIVLQVLLSQAHRLRALRLLARFLQIGSWAIDHALSVGIFPYVLKLLQSQTPELRQELVYIWGKVLALDTSCVLDLVNEKGQIYFVDFLLNGDAPPVYLAMSAFVLSVVASQFPSQLPEGSIVAGCVAALEHPHPLMRRWACLCLQRVIRHSEGINESFLEAPKNLVPLTELARGDEASDVRAVAVSVLITLSLRLLSRRATESSAAMAGKEGKAPEAEGGRGRPGEAVEYAALSERGQTVILDILCTLMLIVETDTSPLVKREVASGLLEIVGERMADIKYFLINHNAKGMRNEVMELLVLLILSLERDPHPIVAGLARRALAKVEVRSEGSEASAAGASRSETSEGGRGALSRQATSNQVSFTQMLESVTSIVVDNITPAASGGDSAGHIFRSTPFMASGTDRAVNDAISVLQPTYEIFSKAILTLRYDTRDNPDVAELEPSLAEDKIGVSFTSARKHLFESDAQSLWTSDVASDFVPNFREVDVLELSGGEIWCTSFLPLDPIIATGDSRGVASLWNTESESLQGRFGIPRRSPSAVCGITTVSVLRGSLEAPIIAAGAADGVVAIWTRRGRGQERIVSTWRASGLPRHELFSAPGDEVPYSHGLVLSWNAADAQIAAAGCEREVLRLWDVSTEKCKGVIRGLADETVTAISSSEHMTLVGGSRGGLAAIDARVRADVISYAVDRNRSGHGCRPLISVQQQMAPSQQHYVLSADAGGIVRRWDSRKPASPLSEVHVGDELTGMTAHPTWPDIVVAGGQRGIRCIDISGNISRALSYHDGFLSQRISPVTSLSLHPRRPLLAVGCADSTLALYR